jgi:copper chaperone NosL
MSKMPWDEPNDGHFIEAQKAWFVIHSSKRGAMGQTLASFGKKEHADAFKEKFGGTGYPCDDITINRLSWSNWG